MRTILKNGLITDGSGQKSYIASLALEGERIVAIGEVE